MFAPMAAVESMFLLQCCGASEVEDEVWLFEPYRLVKPLSEATDVGEGLMTTSVRHGDLKWKLIRVSTFFWLSTD